MLVCKLSISKTRPSWSKIKDYQEGPWFYKHGKYYYMAFASTCCSEGIGYAMSDSPTGPWTYKGDIMPHSAKSRGNHPGIIDYKGKSYVFGLNYLLWAEYQEKIGQAYKHAERRSVSVAEMHYNADGTIQKIDFWPENGVAQIEDFDPYKRVEALFRYNFILIYKFRPLKNQKNACKSRCRKSIRIKCL